MRAAGATVVGKAVRALTRARGGGSAFPGLVVERLHPTYLADVLGPLPLGVVVVSGTNGKTTTTRMLVALLRAHGLRVVSNPTGSNFTRGVISSLLPETDARGRLAADIAVLELDEAHALKFAEVIAPTHTLLLNVARDQLDRFAEIDHTATLLARLGAATTGTVVLNRDDSYVNRVRHDVRPGATIGWFGLDRTLAARLGELQEQDVRAGTADTGPLPPLGPADVRLVAVDDRSFRICSGPEEDPGPDVGPVTLQQRGLAAMINATAATAMARRVLGDRFDPAIAAIALAAVVPPFGRGEVVDIDGTPLELVLVKNPAGFNVALSTYGGTPAATMIAINDDYADGRDVSWLWDVSFEALRGPGVDLTSGVRAWDMALRLDYDDVAVTAVVPELVPALEQFIARHPGRPMRLFCTYTAMMALRKHLVATRGLATFGEEGQ